MSACRLMRECPIKKYPPSMSKKDRMADRTPRKFCVSHSPFTGTNFYGEGMGHFRSSGQQTWKWIWNDTKLLRGVAGPISTPKGYLNTELNAIVSLHEGCRNNALPRSPWEKSQLVAILSLPVESLSAVTRKEYAICGSLLNCLVYSYWPIHFKFLLVSNFQLYCFLTICIFLQRLSVCSINPTKKNGLTVRKYREYSSRFVLSFFVITVTGIKYPVSRAFFPACFLPCTSRSRGRRVRRLAYLRLRVLRAYCSFELKALFGRRPNNKDLPMEIEASDPRLVPSHFLFVRLMGRIKRVRVASREGRKKNRRSMTACGLLYSFT